MKERKKKLRKDFERDKARKENGEGGGHMCADEASGKVALTSWCSTTTTISTNTTTIWLQQQQQLNYNHNYVMVALYFLYN